MKVYLGTEETTQLSSASGGKKVLKNQNHKKALSDVKDISYKLFFFSIQTMKQDQIPEAVYLYDVENVTEIFFFFKHICTQVT